MSLSEVGVGSPNRQERYPQAPIHPQAPQKSQPSLRVTVKCNIPGMIAVLA